MTRSTKIQAQASDRETKKQLIIDVAFRMFAEQEFEKVSLRDIANAVGLHMATLYHYFPNKRALYEEVVADSWKRGSQEMIAGISGSGDASTRLKQWVRTMTGFLMEDSSVKLMERDLLALESGNPVFTRKFLEQSHTRLLVGEMIEDMAPSILSDISAERLVEILHGLIYGVVRFRPVHRATHVKRDDLDRESIERDLIRVIEQLLFSRQPISD